MNIALPEEALRAIIAVQQEIVETDLSLEGVMNVVAHAARRLTGSDAAVIELHEGDDMVYRAASGAASEFIGLRLRSDQSLSGLCVSLDQALRCDDSESDARVDREACRQVGARSLLVTPLRFRGTPLGVLKVYSAQRAAFDDGAAEIVRLLTGIVSASMQRARDHEWLTKRALRDTLTGLANREQLDSSMRDRIDAHQPFALAFLDLDEFKRINDTAGHSTGDDILRVVGNRLNASLRERDLAARFGGDEFVMLLDGVVSRTDADHALSRVLERVNTPIDLQGRHFMVSASGGVVMFPHDGTTAGDLIRTADRRMYERKRQPNSSS